ncbi:MAG: hypothetical protein O7B35_05040, partial [Deltaproteobacteria bacterium]|nr:hypothetical protein [Deltaproteobacteria bacterium]
KGRSEQQVVWKRVWQKRKYGEQCQEKLSRITPSEIKRLIAVSNELCKLQHFFKYFQSFHDYRARNRHITDDLARLEKDYVSECLVRIMNIITVLRRWETNLGSPKRMPALTLREIDLLLSPDLLEAPLPDDEQTSWRFEQARFIKEAITRAMHGPITVDDLIDEYITYYYETTPHGKQAAAVVAALDRAGFACPYDGKSWSEALKDENLNAKVKSFFSARYRKINEPQS